MPEHPQVMVECGSRRAWIDEEVAPLILEIWKAGLDTYNSCQDNDGGRVWVQFATAAGAEAFLDAIATFDEEIYSLYNRITGEWEPEDWQKWRVEEAWQYDAHVEDSSVEELDENGRLVLHSHGRAAMRFSLSVRFPRKELEDVLARMVLFNRGVGV